MPPIDCDAYDCVTDVDALDRWIARAQRAGVIAFDTETDCLEAMHRAVWSGSAWPPQPGRACYIPLAHGGTDMFSENPEQVPMGVAIVKLKALLEDPSGPQNWPQHQVRSESCCAAWLDDRAAPRHDGDELRSRRGRTITAWMSSPCSISTTAASHSRMSAAAADRRLASPGAAGRRHALCR